MVIFSCSFVFVMLYHFGLWSQIQQYWNTHEYTADHPREARASTSHRFDLMFSPTEHDICNIFFSQHERSASFQYFSCLCYPSLLNKLQSVKAGSAGVASIKTTTVPKHCWYLLIYDIFKGSPQLFVFVFKFRSHNTEAVLPNNMYI